MSALVVAAVVRRGDDVLLVRQQGPHDLAPCWALPGGRVEPGESPTQAIAREVLEETGLRVVRLGGLLCVSHALHSATGLDWLALTFELDEWTGEPQPLDPDGFVTECAFFPAALAAEMLGALTWRSMREPGVAVVSSPGGPVRLFEFSEL